MCPYLGTRGVRSTKQRSTPWTSPCSRGAVWSALWCEKSSCDVTKYLKSSSLGENYAGECAIAAIAARVESSQATSAGV